MEFGHRALGLGKARRRRPKKRSGTGTAGGIFSLFRDAPHQWVQAGLHWRTYRYSALNSFEAGQTVALPVDAGVRDVLGQTSDHLVGAGGHPCPQLRVPEGGPGDFRRRTGDLGVMWNVPGRFGPQGPRVTTSKDDSNKRRLCVLQPTLVRRSWRPRQGVRAVPQGAQTSTGYM